MFLASTDATFYLTLETKFVTGHENERELRVVDDRSVAEESTSDDGTIELSSDEEVLVDDGGIKFPMLQSFLRSFGEIRSVSPVDTSEGIQQVSV